MFMLATPFSCCGKAFHSLGAATVNVASPALPRVRGCVVFSEVDEFDLIGVLCHLRRGVASSASGCCVICGGVLQAGASIHALDKGLGSPVMAAAQRGKHEVVNYLLKAGAIVDSKVKRRLCVRGGAP